jgi:peroxiredoxin
MKKIITIVLLSSPVMVMAQGGKYTIKGKVGALSAPAKVYLRYSNDGVMVSDSVVPQNGLFRFEGRVENPVRGSLSVNHTGSGRVVDGLSFYLEKGTIEVGSTDSVKNAVIRGSKLNEDNQRLQAALKAVNDQSRDLNASYASLSAEQRKDETVMAGINKRSEQINQERKAALKMFIAENPQSVISVDALNTYGGFAPEYDDVAPLFQSLTEKVRNSKAGMDYAAKLEKVKLTAVGAVAPLFTQNDVNGQPVSLASFRGKYLLIDFWASWCGPCRAENPNVVKAFEKYKDQNFTILGVSLDQPNAREKWLKAIADDHLDWTQVSDLAYWKNAVAVQYGINAIPQNFLLDKEGKIIAKNIRGEALQKTLEKYLKP